MKLLLEVGNSRIKCATLDAGLVQGLQDTCYDKQAIAASLLPLLSSLPVPQQVWVSCVAGKEVEQQLRHCLNDHWQLEPEFLSTEVSWNGLRNGYRQPQQLGVDRWLALMAAWHRFAQPCVVMDAGTAVTIDAIDASGNHLGGLILPGLKLMEAALLHHTSLRDLHQEAAAPAALPLADNTLQGVKWGTFLAVTSLAERIVRQVAAETAVSPRCLLTGGSGQFLLSRLPADWEYDAQLVLKGMALKVAN